jgi:hypothetical protein
VARAEDLLPRERVYPLASELAGRIGAGAVPGHSKGRPMPSTRNHLAEQERKNDPEEIYSHIDRGSLIR